MNRRQRYHYCAADCLATAQEAYNPYRRKLYLSMAASWLSLAHHAEAADRLFAMLDPAIGTDETFALMKPATDGATTSRFGQSVPAHPEPLPSRHFFPTPKATACSQQFDSTVCHPKSFVK